MVDMKNEPDSIPPSGVTEKGHTAVPQHWTELLSDARASGKVDKGLGFYSESKVGPTQYVRVNGLLNMGTVEAPKLVEGGILAIQPGKPPMHMTEQQAKDMQDRSTAHIQHHGGRAFINAAVSIPAFMWDSFATWATGRIGDPAKKLERFRTDQVKAHANQAADSIQKCRTEMNKVARHPEIEPLLKQRSIMEANGNPNDPMHLTEIRNNTRQIDAALDRNPDLRDSLNQAQAYATAAGLSQAEFFNAAKQAEISNPFEHLDISSQELESLSKLSESFGTEKLSEKLSEMLDEFQDTWNSISESIQNAIQKLLKPGG